MIEVKLSNVTEIGQCAFVNCLALKTIDLSKVKKFGNQSFSGCASLTTIDLRSAEVLMDATFGDCTKLTKILNSSRINRIYGDPFMYCTSLVEFRYPKNAEVISNAHFLKGCASIKTVYMYKGDLAMNKRRGSSKEDLEGFFKKMVGHPVEIVAI